MGTIAIAILIFGFGGWAVTANLASAVVGTGSVAVEGNVKRVQHRDGGIVGRILVEDGDMVAANDLLIELDATVTRANLAIVETRLDQLLSRSARLVAERDGAEHMTLPDEIASRRGEPAIASLIASEETLFAARRSAIEGLKSQLRERITQVDQETGGLIARREAKEDELDLIEEELEGVESLYKQGLTSMARYAELRRMKTQLAGELGQLVAEIARAETRKSETRLQIIQLDEDRRAEVMTELRDIEGRISELSEQRIAALDQLQRLELRAPQAGIVHQLQVHTIGGVVGPGETIMQIVPTSNALVIEARVQANDIDQVHVGQNATLRFSAFNQRTTPEIRGYVTGIGADLIRNQETREAWYTVKLGIQPEELERLDGLALVPGMPVETFIRTHDRTAASYLLKPLTDQLARAFREE
ncbi:MAG: HlyD family type I secretion periplasmic adaptor subunit [Rhizobiaceae bacterium]|nr:HlyD family type I secretion periplasmic adaptor subunit [Rhizobiaceae bacterium]MCV0407823.1 HlyD family type I secretion periplasmic adaptor subunit [Rhizobiaceae bacterium]